MKTFVNVYIILFLCDGIVSLLDAMAGWSLGMHPLSIVQGTIAFAVWALSIPLYFLVGCVRGFPKRVVLPFVLFSLWIGILIACPLLIFLGTQKAVLILSLVQCGFGFMMLAILHRANENKEWLYRKADFEQLTFRWKRLAGFTAANVFLVIPLFGIYLVACLSFAISYKSQGFIHLGMRGLSMETRTYLHEGKNIILLPMAHIARAGFYDESVTSLPEENTVVIPEGVTDKDKLLKDGLDHEKLARSMRLKAQDNRIIIAKRETVQCDVDVNEFSPGTLDFLRTCIGITRAWSSGNRVMALQKSLAIGEPDIDLLRKDLLDLRNQRVIDCIADCLKRYENIVIPWGAAHMPGIENGILERGGRVIERKRVQVFGWASSDKKSSDPLQ